MRAAFLCYLTQAWTADRDRQAQRHAPARAPSHARHPRPSPRAHRARELLTVVARRVRIMPGGGSP